MLILQKLRGFSIAVIAIVILLGVFVLWFPITAVIVVTTRIIMTIIIIIIISVVVGFVRLLVFLFL